MRGPARILRAQLLIAGDLHMMGRISFMWLRTLLQMVFLKFTFGVITSSYFILVTKKAGMSNSGKCFFIKEIVLVFPDGDWMVLWGSSGNVFLHIFQQVVFFQYQMIFSKIASRLVLDKWWFYRGLKLSCPVVIIVVVHFSCTFFWWIYAFQGNNHSCQMGIFVTTLFSSVSLWVCSVRSSILGINWYPKPLFFSFISLNFPSVLFIHDYFLLTGCSQLWGTPSG